MSSSDSQQRQFSLRIERGRTRFPERPIDEERFLIGAGSNCHLQLGGEMPILHSVVVATSSGLWIDSVVKTPQLLVNRQPVRECELLSGDILEIGDFTFVVEEKSVMTDSIPIDDSDNDHVDLRDLSAEDLVDLLDEEMTTLEEYEAARTSGAKALLDTASEIQPQVKVPESEIDLQSLAAQLAKQASELDIRESILAEKADHLQKAQERLEKQIELLTSRVKSEQDDSDESFRKTA